MATPLDSTYGVWLVSLVLETMLYGMGILQTWSYFAALPTDIASVKGTVLVVLTLETVQVVFFFRSSYFRFVERFGQIQLDLIWADSLQLLAAYVSGFIVQIYFVSRIHKLTKGRRTKFSLSAFGIYLILLLAVVQIVAGIVQTVWSYKLRSFLKLGETKPITTLQAASSLVCDLLITLYLCLFLKSQKGDMVKTNSMMDMLIHDAITRGVLTSVSSGVNMILFLALPNTFWFFLGLAPNSKFYMNSMLATLNSRQHIRDRIAANDKGWNSIQMATLTSNTPKKIQGQASVAAVDFETASVDISSGKQEDFLMCP
ncbi:hypothetical protein MSAN_01375300 [Mycena sanguinolenta]|uniref:DUF6534 domain-containing protein n=1 Tax=Mycena sanguinolenta TaxID=230812 RepID=A0A8H6YA63_9AGAR|nr:hypothetical protein MSAN_01375300 [Mycena sanguinolenta]